MKVLVLVLLCSVSAVACGSRSVGSEEPSESGGTVQEQYQQPVVASVLVVSMEFEQQASEPPTTQVSLIETNETGASTRHNLGVFDGECKDVTTDVRRSEPKVLLAFHCKPFENQRGVLVHIVARRSQLILLRAWLGSTKPTFDEFDQIGELPPFPTGVPIKTEYDL